jgi:serine protease Do
MLERNDNNEENRTGEMGQQNTNPATAWQVDDNGCTYHYSNPSSGANTAGQNTTQNQTTGTQQYGYHAPYTAAPNPSSAQPQYRAPQPKKDKKKVTGKYRAAALIAACMILSLGCGFGGTVIANHISTSSDTTSVSEQASSASSSDSDGLFQESTDDNTASSSDSSGVASSAVSSGSTMSTEDVVKTCADSVVEIVTESVSTNSMFGQYVTSGAGSGVILTEDGYIVTNNHVIEDATTIKVTLRNGSEYDATLVATDEQSDIAVIKIEGSGLTCAVFADSDKLAVGQTAIAIGNPLGSLGGSVSQGILSALDREITIDDSVMTLLQTDAAINPGNSGGGLFNDKGELIGIVNAKSTGEEIDGLGFAIPSNLVKSVAEQLIEQGYVSGRISTGMSLIDIDDMYTAMYYGVSRTGVYVQSLTGSNAQEAGLKTGDCIIAVGDTAVSSVSEFNAAIKEYSIGDTVSLTVIRGSQRGTLSLVLEEYTGAIQ